MQPATPLRKLACRTHCYLPPGRDDIPTFTPSMLTSTIGIVAESVLPRDAMLARYMLSSCVCPPVRHKPVLYRNDGLSWFLAWELPLIYAKVCCKDIRVPSKVTALPSGTLDHATYFTV